MLSSLIINSVDKKSKKKTKKQRMLSATISLSAAAHKTDVTYKGILNLYKNKYNLSQKSLVYVSRTINVKADFNRLGLFTCKYLGELERSK